MIREATENDLAAIVDLAERFYITTPFAEAIPFDEESAGMTALQLIKSPDCLVMVSEMEAVVTGVISGSVVPAYWNLAFLVGQQMTWYVNPRHRGSDSLRLFDAWEKWAIGKGAKLLLSGAKINGRFPLMDKMLKARGYMGLENSYIKEVH